MRIFKNNDNQMRSGWKIGILYFLFTITTSIFSGIFSVIYTAFLYAKNPKIFSGTQEGMNYIEEQFFSMNHIPGICLYLIQCFVMIFFVVLFWKVLDKRKVRDIGLINIKNSWKDLLGGLLIGAASFTTVALILIFTNSVELVNNFNKPNFSWVLIVQFVIFIFVGINEELFSRGYCMTVLKQTKIAWVPIIISSIIFALMHSFNQGISFLAYINLFLFGITMGYIYIKTKNIWMCIGYHITWNYFQGDVFGFLVSGNETNSIYAVKMINPNIINGGNFGPEGGLVVTILLIITIFLIYKFMPSREAKNSTL